MRCLALERRHVDLGSAEGNTREWLLEFLGEFSPLQRDLKRNLRKGHAFICPIACGLVVQISAHSSQLFGNNLENKLEEHSKLLNRQKEIQKILTLDYFEF